MPPVDAQDALPGDAMLESITDAIVALQLRYYHRVPAMAGTRVLGGDLIACTLGGLSPDVEPAPAGPGHPDVLQDVRREVELAVQQTSIAVVERLTGRSVAAFLPSHDVGSDEAVDLFLLEPTDGEPDRDRSG